jgi:hypothetical protein
VARPGGGGGGGGGVLGRGLAQVLQEVFTLGRMRQVYAYELGEGGTGGRADGGGGHKAEEGGEGKGGVKEEEVCLGGVFGGAELLV